MCRRDGASPAVQAWLSPGLSQLSTLGVPARPGHGKRDAGSPRSSLGTLRAPSLRPQPSGKDHRLGPLDQTGSTDRESFGL